MRAVNSMAFFFLSIAITELVLESIGHDQSITFTLSLWLEPAKEQIEQPFRSGFLTDYYQEFSKK